VEDQPQASNQYIEAFQQAVKDLRSLLDRHAELECEVRKCLNAVREVAMDVTASPETRQNALAIILEMEPRSRRVGRPPTVTKRIKEAPNAKTNPS
jgi:hypothetical protein